MRDEAWMALKHLTRGTKEIIELAGEAEKLAKRLHPQDAEAAEKHAVDAFLSALDRPLASEVRKLGHTQMEGVVADARRIEKILQEQPTPTADSELESMNRQIQILKKDLLKVNEKLAAQATTPPQTASLALPATPVVAATQPPLAAFMLHSSTLPWLLHLSTQPLRLNMCRIISLCIGRKIRHISGGRTGGRSDGQ